MIRIEEVAFQILEYIHLWNQKFDLIFLDQIKYLKIKDIEFTWVWYYINFYYDKKIGSLFPSNVSSLSCNKILFINDFKEHFDFELSITNGKIDFLEIVTYWNFDWDWKIQSFKITSST